MPSRPFLTIGIPTYNRAQSLKKSLEIILRQCQNQALSGQVEVVISDNASTDETPAVVKDFEASGFVRYSRNSRNLNFDRNVVNVLRKAQGEFCWTLSDDEVLAEGAVSYILEFLRGHPDLAYVCISQSRQAFRDVLFFPSGEQWLEKLGLMGGLLSQNIFNIKFLPQNLEKYYDNLWVHFSIALEIMANRPAALVKNVFISSDKPKVARWAKDGLAFTTYINLKRIIQNLSGLGYGKRVIGKLFQDFAKGLPRTIASAKLQGLKVSLSGTKILFQEFWRYPFWLTLSFFVYFCPKFILVAGRNFLAKIYPNSFQEQFL